MENIIKEIGREMGLVGKDVEHAVLDVVEWLPKAEVVVTTAIKDQAEFRAAALDLVKKGATVLGDISTDVADKGINLTADKQTLTDAEAFFEYFKDTFVPLVETIYKQIETNA